MLQGKMQMDLRFTSQTARHAVIWVLNAIGVVLLLWATSSYGSSRSAPRDYLFAPDVQGGRVTRLSGIQSASSAKAAKHSVNVQYQAFDGQFHDLVEHQGRHVAILLPQDVDEGPFFTTDHIEELVDRLDMLYLLYRELLHLEPAGPGKLNIAYVPETCGMGCGLVGSKGIEILSDPWNYESIIRELNAGRLETILVHELVHNFDAYSQYLHYLPDHAHAWTDMFEYFAPYRYARSSRNNEAPDDIYNSPVRSVWKDYVSEESADWASCVRDQACEDSGLTANNVWAMLYYRIETLHGVEALLGSFRFITEYASTAPPPGSLEEKEDLRILSLAVGVGANIACYMESLKWPLSAGVRAEMERRFGSDDSFCADSDLDGFTEINGDCDDSDPSRNILGSEIAGNGLDDDCDDLIDEEHLVESELGGDPDNFTGAVQTGLPFEVRGSSSDSEDRDRFHFPLRPSKRARITICASDEFRGWAVALQPDGRFLDADNWYSYLPFAGCFSNSFDFDGFSIGGVSVIADETAGEYSLTVSEASKLTPDHSAALRVTPRMSGGVTLNVSDRDSLFENLGAEELEFWVSGAGIQLFRPFQPEMTVDLPPSLYPELLDGKQYQVRMRPRAGGLPLAAFTAGHVFSYAKQPHPPQIDSGYSGAWFDPEHEGEGLIVEILENDRALVYWFSYHEDGRQRWLLGTGELRENLLLVDDLMDTHGGRFGPDFDPDDVTLKHRGMLSISFVNCMEALLNYSVDDNGGHLALKRLTSVHGHGCPTDDSPDGSAHESSPAIDLSGSWSDPSHDGEGFIIEQLGPEQALVVWFSYDASGNQSWFMDRGTIAGSRISFPGLHQPLGGRFGRSFDPANIERRPWGELTLDMDCSGGVAVYSPTAEAYTGGSQNLLPLTRLRNSGCAR